MLKNLLKTILILPVLMTISCSNTKEIVGEINYFNYAGFQCWYVKDLQTGFLYEIMTPDAFLLEKGRKVRMKFTTTDDDTICKLPETIEVVAYSVIK